MEYYRCENPDCGFTAEMEPDACPRCGGAFFFAVNEEELSAANWVSLGNQAVEEKRETDALAYYQRAAADKPGMVSGGRRGCPRRSEAGSFAICAGGGTRIHTRADEFRILLYQWHRCRAGRCQSSGVFPQGR